MRSVHRAFTGLFIVSLLAACGDVLPTEEEGLAPSGDPAGSVAGSGLPVYGLGGFVRATPGDPCAEPSYEEFDFWVGEWDVFNPAGDQVGTNSVRKELEGCVVSESWTDSGGGRGRSINTYDAETGQWHQTWVSAFNSGHLRMSGGLDPEGRMVLSGQRDAVLRGFTLFDEYTWTALGPDRVEQVGTVDVPAVGFHGEFVGIYERREAITPAPESPTTGCQAGGPSEQSRQLDFWVGSWSVAAASGRELGTSHVSTDLSGCLVEERFETPSGYAAVSFAAFDFWEQTWFRTYIDNRAERLEVTGALARAAVVMTGEEDAAGGPAVTLRITLEPMDDGRVRQLWETSRDGGTSWKTAVDLIYTPL